MLTDHASPLADLAGPLNVIDINERVDLRRVGSHPDHWYPVAWSSTLKASSAIGVRFAGLPIAIFRTKTGKIYALEDRCAHRQVPLSEGVVDGENLRCNYHGWTYSCSGACVDVPYIGMGRTRLPNGVKSYPVMELDGLIFVFPGNPDLAEAKKLPSLGAAADPRYKTRRLNREVAAHYTFMHENLMDMNHQYLHRKQMGMVRAQCLGKRHGDDWVEVDYTFSRGGARARSAGEKVILSLGRSEKNNGRFADLMTIATRYPYQDLRVWIGRKDEPKLPVLHVWLGYLPLGPEQKSNRTFGYLSVLKPRIPGILHLFWPLVTMFTERIFTEDKTIVEQEQTAHDKQGMDLNNEIFPAIQDVRALLTRCGMKPERQTSGG